MAKNRFLGKRVERQSGKGIFLDIRKRLRERPIALSSQNLRPVIEFLNRDLNISMKCYCPQKKTFKTAITISFVGVGKEVNR